MLNACNARFLNLQLFIADGSADGITLNPKTLLPTNARGPDFMVQIGTEGGFLPAPVSRSTRPNHRALQPADLQRHPDDWPRRSAADLIMDFNGLARQKVILYTDAPAPFPIGDPRNDYFPGWHPRTPNPHHRRASGPTPGRSCDSGWGPARPTCRLHHFP